MTFDSSSADFWDKDEPKVMGDIRARPNAIKLLGDIRGKKVLDAGCGTGYMSRMLAKSGAQVYGIDESREMLAKAENKRKNVSDWLEFRQASIHSTGFDLKFFDNAIMVGVLMYDNNPLRAIGEMYRVLKPEGKLVVSVTHPYIYQEGSPAVEYNNKRGRWLDLLCLGEENGVEIFEQHYMDKFGNKSFNPKVYNHSISTYFNSLTQNGFNIEKVEEIEVKKEDLLHPSWGTKHGYHAYLQILARREK
jgi:ubiquinone/menaquinone biosynthesis C-methylase UbiE